MVMSVVLPCPFIIIENLPAFARMQSIGFPSSRNSGAYPDAFVSLLSVMNIFCSVPASTLFLMMNCASSGRFVGKSFVLRVLPIAVVSTRQRVVYLQGILNDSPVMLP